ncbi:hypothetical protein Lfu02_14630 [Longispora fulva]|uniref:Peptidoglycan/LPS O-acetylase OafA/YrhL n=1 Tax=Longispora fulva TaxID=619741 RepID=A0A8J7GNQ0_9ACTN|nr:hypothetical protein [Longispora fulva]MBG6140527.1 peptidoglycan/LPS O-acetylase OafA/YrhL [Longispora fulva]GIG57091.1 hypothetical protein Lfu02_14630 [Longispora fulva]
MASVFRRRALIAGGLLLWSALLADCVLSIEGIIPSLPVGLLIVLSVAAAMMCLVGVIAGTGIPAQHAFILGMRFRAQQDEAQGQQKREADPQP